MRIGILGGGLSGIALQRMLRHPSEVLEKEEAFGGLCRTCWKDGFGYDLGGHILFSRNEAVNEMVTEVLGENLHQRRRNNRVLYAGRYVKYPFENDLASLDLQDRYECLVEYLRADFPPPSNLAEWCCHHFGRGIAERYLIPYNRKIWKTDPRQMSLEWVGRIPRPPLEDVVKSALGIETEGYAHQLYFRYPRRGGIESLVTSLARPGGVRVPSFEVRSLRQGDSGWTVSDGRNSREYDRVVIAFPVHEAVRALAGPSPELLERASRLVYNSLRVVFLAVDNLSLMDKSAVYIPDSSVLPHRVCFMGFFSPAMVRAGTSSLIAEITCREGDEVSRMSETEVIEKTVGDLDRIGIIRRPEVICSEVRSVRHAYPVYNLEYAENVAFVRRHFASLGIDLLGRFAEFDYINMDECLARAMALARRLNALP